jgi:hypothetical protein
MQNLSRSQARFISLETILEDEERPIPTFGMLMFRLNTMED